MLVLLTTANNPDGACRAEQGGRRAAGPARVQAAEAASQPAGSKMDLPFLLFLFCLFPLFTYFLFFFSCLTFLLCPFFSVLSLFFFSPDSSEKLKRTVFYVAVAVWTLGSPWWPALSGPAVCVRGPGVSGGPGAPFGVTRGASLLRPGCGQDGALQSSVARLWPGRPGSCLSRGAQGWSVTIEIFRGDSP